MKTACVIVKGTGQPKVVDVDLEKGATPADIKRSVGIKKKLEQWELLRVKTNETIPEGTDVFKLVDMRRSLT